MGVERHDRHGPARDFLVYALANPLTTEVRYVGLSSIGLARPRQHSAPSQCISRTKPHTACSRWVTSLVLRGYRPEIRVLERCADRDALAASEVRWIAALREHGCRLLNLTAGGDGAAAVTEEVRRRKSDSQKGRVFSAHHRARISAAKKGKRFTDEHCAAIRAAKSLGMSDETRAKIAAAGRLRRASAETRERMAAAQRARRAAEASS